MGSFTSVEFTICLGDAGCYFSSAGGLCSFAHPKSTLKPVPRIDSQGQMCGSMFKVIIDIRDQNMPLSSTNIQDSVRNALQS